MITGINHLTWNVTDIDESFDFYVNLLGFKPIMKSNESAYFLAGDIWIAVILGEPRNDERYDHIAFNIKLEDYKSLVNSLRQNNVRQWQSNSTEGESFYFLDPSGNKFELHYSDLAARIADGKMNWGADIEWFV